MAWDARFGGGCGLCCFLFGGSVCIIVSTCKLSVLDSRGAKWYFVGVFAHPCPGPSRGKPLPGGSGARSPDIRLICCS